MEVRQISLAEANAYVIQHHRHHGSVIGHKWSIAAYHDGLLCGVAIIGRPVSRKLDDGKTLEITRLCTDGTHNACSFLYAAAAHRAQKEGYEKIVTYILQSEPGTSLKAAGWKMEAKKAGRPRWNAQRYADRPQQLTLFPRKEPPMEYKQRWSKLLGKAMVEQYGQRQGDLPQRLPGQGRELSQELR